MLAELIAFVIIALTTLWILDFYDMNVEEIKQPKLKTICDDTDSYNYVTNVPYFRNDRYLTTNKIWAGKNGPSAPTGPAQGATPYAGMWLLPKSQKNYKNILNIPDNYTKYPKLGIENERRIYQRWPLI